MQVVQSPSEMQMVQKAFLAGLQSETHAPYASHPMTPSPHGVGGYFLPSPGMNTMMMSPQQQQMAYAAYPGDMNAIHHAQYLSHAYNAHLSRAYMSAQQLGMPQPGVVAAQPLIQTGTVLEVYVVVFERGHSNHLCHSFALQEGHSNTNARTQVLGK